MAFKRNKKSEAPELVSSPTMPPFLDVHSQKVSEHIARLEQRHRALVEETAQELEILKETLNKDNDVRLHIAQAQQPLLQEIAGLRNNITQAEQEKHHLENEIQRLQGALGSLKHNVKSQVEAFDQQVRLFSLDTDQAIDELLGSLKPATKTEPLVQHHEPLPLVTDDNLEALLAEFSPEVITNPVIPIPVFETFVEKKVKPVKIKKEKTPRSFKGLRTFAIRSIAFALIGIIAWSGFKFVSAHNKGDVGQVAGVSTASTPNPDDSTEKYKESYAAVTFEDTQWETLTDTDLGFSIRYPKNASNLVRTVGGSNDWFLRFDGYMMRVSKEETVSNLDQWWAASKDFYADGNTSTKGTFKGHPAWIIKPLQTSITSGTTSVVSVPGGIMQVWTKDEDPNTDDGKRLAKMVESFSFTAN
jgi:hypothetical protein